MSRLLRTCALATILLAVSVAARPLGVQRDAHDAIEWPSDEFPTLQSAIDALRDGGRLKIRPGRFDLREPLVVRNKILLFEPLYAQIKDSHVLLTGPFPPGHVHAGNFGDGVIVAGQGTVWVGNSRIHTNARAGISNLGSFVDLGSSRLTCKGFDLEGEPYQLPTDNFLFNDRGANRCGCPLANQECVAVSAVFVPPQPVQVVE